MKLNVIGCFLLFRGHSKRTTNLRVSHPNLLPRPAHYLSVGNLFFPDSSLLFLPFAFSFSWSSMLLHDEETCVVCVRVCASVVCVCMHTCPACVSVRAWTRVCVIMKKVLDEWQARQAKPTTLQVRSSRHNANKNTTRGRGPFHQSITVVHTVKKEKQSLFLYSYTCCSLPVSGPRLRQE